MADSLVNRFSDRNETRIVVRFSLKFIALIRGEFSIELLNWD